MKMVRHSSWILLFLLLFFLSGCIHIHLSTARTAKDKLEETVVQGKGRDKILLLDITGFLSDLPPWKPYSPTVTTLNDVKEKLRKAEKDPLIKGVILRINSPGGTVTASDTIFEEIRRFKEEKKIPVIAQMMDTAASGGYYAALAADQIAAQPTTITGSIGVMIQKFNLEELLAKIGIANTPVTSGIHKDIGSPFRAQTAEEKEILQKTIDSLYHRFVETVVNNREELSREEVLTLADGRIYTADLALEKGLIDRIGYLNESIEEVKKLAKIEKARVVVYHLPRSYRENIYSASPHSPVTEIHLFDLNRGVPLIGTHFLYLWDPGGM
jgi:protease-4